MQLQTVQQKLIGQGPTHNSDVIVNTLTAWVPMCIDRRLQHDREPPTSSALEGLAGAYIVLHWLSANNHLK